ncbi:MAG: (5-formylfuran-3-yl)methyl phosphate synthase [Methanocellales archaeon]|nr:(5-formylfuran-3-yl)methyl phosphate synthase [Methanocellales archaeon]
MKLLVSVVDADETIDALKGGADIIDVKNPREGALGANFPWIINEIKQALPDGIEMSCALGDVPHLPGTVSLAALGCASIGPDYIKVGLYGTKNQGEASEVMRAVVRSVGNFNDEISIIASGYADFRRVGSFDPMLLPEVASESGCEGILVDTGIKDGTRLFDFMSLEKIRDFIECGHGFGLLVALAGSLRSEDVLLLREMKPDVIGVRGAACEHHDRKGRISLKRVTELKKIFR